jgi:hypothetical protein
VGRRAPPRTAICRSCIVSIAVVKSFIVKLCDELQMYLRAPATLGATQEAQRAFATRGLAGWSLYPGTDSKGCQPYAYSHKL